MHINFLSSNDTGEVRTVFVWSDNEEIRFGNETDDIIKDLLILSWIIIKKQN